MTYIRGKRTCKVFNLLYLTKIQIIVKSYFFLEFLTLDYLSPFISNILDEGSDGRIGSLFL
jgi:hypothetical protein